MEARALRFGVMGTGFGAAVHVPGLRTVTGALPVAIAGGNEEAVRAAAARLGVEAAYGVDDLLDRDLDAVTVAVPPDRMEEVVGRCLDRGVPVLCEKPLGTDRACAERLLARASGLTTALDFQFAELETFQAATELLGGGSLGAVRHAVVEWFVQSYAQEHRLFGWKTDADRWGGVLNLLASHAFHVLELFLGPVAVLTATLDDRATQGFTPQGRAPAEDAAFVTTRHRGGALATLAIGNAAPGASLHRWRLYCDGGIVTLENASRDYMGGFVLAVVDASGASLLTRSEPAAAGDGRLPPFARLAGRFAEAVRAGTRCVPDFAAGVRVAAILDAVRASAADGRAKEIEPS